MRYHANAVTTVEIRKAIIESKESNSVLAERYNCNERTIRRWRKRTDLEDRSHRPHNIKYAISIEELELFKKIRIEQKVGLDECIKIVSGMLGKNFKRGTVYRYFKLNNLNNLRKIDFD